MEPHLIVELLMQYLDRQPENDKLRIRLYMALRQAILDRALAQGVKLPPTRVLAADLRLVGEPAHAPAARRPKRAKSAASTDST